MIILIWILLLITAVLILSYQRASLSVATIGISVLLLILSLLFPLSGIALLIIWIIWGLFAVLFNIHPLRRVLISKGVMSVLARHAPKFSATEQAVLAAGNLGWEAELFSGQPDLKKLIEIPWVQLNPAEQAFLTGPVEELCVSLDPWSINLHQQVPDKVWEHLKQNGYFGLVIPEQYGGKGFSAYAHAQVVMKLASVNTSVATIASVPNSLGPAELLLHYGTDAQKNYYLPRLASGEEIPCFALTSPVAGSDAGAMTDFGIVCRYRKNDQEVLGIRLNWDKRYITLAPVATLLGLAFQLYDPEHLLGDQEALGITCALIPVNTPGVHIGRHHDPLTSAFPNGPTQGVDVLVEIDAIIGGVSHAGKGWQMLMERLAAGRSISLPSIAMGGIKIAAISTGAYARIRRQFNTYIGDFGGVQEELARIAGQAFIAESLRLFSVAQVDQGIHSATAAAISKYHTTELGRNIIRAAMDIHGGKGICMGPHNYLAQVHIESPISITVEGANILTRSLIIFGQGALRCHPYLLPELSSARHKNLKSFDQAFFGHVGYLFGNQVRAFILGLTRACLVVVPKQCVPRRYFQQLSWFSTILAVAADIILITTGDALKRKEQLSARLGDLLSDLYMISAVLRHYQALAENSELLPIIDWTCQALLCHFQQQLTDLLANLPNRFIAGWLRLITFPLGKPQHRPMDRLTIQSAQLLMQPGVLRDCLRTNACFTGNLADLENTLQQMIAVEPLLKKVSHAKHEHLIRGYHFQEVIADAVRKQIISSAEAQQIQAAEALRMSIIKVDDFAFAPFEKGGSA